MSDKSTEDSLIGPVLYRPEEEIINSDKLFEVLDNYVTYNIGKIYGIGLLEFVSLPKLDSRALLLHARKINEERGDAIEDLINEHNI